MTQYQIEQAAGITNSDIANYIMIAETDASRNALSLLQTLVTFWEPIGHTLLECAVKDCKWEMENRNANKIK